MLVAAVHNNSKELRKLSDLLVTAFPGAVVYEFTAVGEVVDYVRDRKPDAVLLGLDMQIPENMKLLQDLRCADLKVPVVVCADDDGMLDEAMWNGASGYLVKPFTVEDIREAIIMDI